jgi:hypothetical protein
MQCGDMEILSIKVEKKDQSEKMFNGNKLMKIFMLYLSILIILYVLNNKTILL